MRAWPPTAAAVAVALVLSSAPVSPLSADAPPYEADVARIRALFEGRQFQKLTDLLAGYQAASEENVRWEYALIDGFEFFKASDPSYKALLDEWVRAAPGNWVPRIARACYYHRSGWKARGHKLAKDTSDEQFRGMKENFESAVRDINAALKINPRLVYAYFIMMDINKNLGDPVTNALLVKRALDLSPHSYAIRRLHILTLTPRWGGSYEAMEEFARESAPYAATNPLIKTLGGFVYWDQASMAGIDREYRKAVDLYEKSLSYGENIDFLEGLAKSYLDAHLFDRAAGTVETIDNALRTVERAMAVRRPPPARLHGLRAKILLVRGQTEEAFKDIETIERLWGPRSDEAIEIRESACKWIVLGGTALQNTDFPRAVERYSLALRLYPQSVFALYFRGAAYARVKKTEDAIDDLRSAIASDPLMYGAYVALDQVLFGKGRFDEIVELWTRYLEMEPGNDNAYLERSGTYFHKRDFVSSYRDARRACQLGNPEGCRRMDKLKAGPLADRASRIDLEMELEVDASIAPGGGRNPVRFKTVDGKWSFRDAQGKVLADQKFDDAFDFREGFARVKRNGKWGYIDIAGNLSVEPRYDYCWDFSGGKAKVRLEDGSTPYIDHTGKLIGE